jgi:hypothetical protein
MNKYNSSIKYLAYILKLFMPQKMKLNIVSVRIQA